MNRLISFFATGFLFLLINTESSAQVSHQVFDNLLKSHVTNTGVVNYAAFKKDEAKLDKYLATLKANHPKSSWKRNDKLAYWINAYNAFTIKLILKNMPVKSIMDINNGKAWDVEWIKIGENRYSLNHIENKIIRPEFNEPRIHFAVNCAAKSCPPLLNAAYNGATLETQLQNQTTKFIQNKNFNTVAPNQLMISKIFEWYASDFGVITKYVDQYTNVRVASDAEVIYVEYNWALNGLTK